MEVRLGRDGDIEEWLATDTSLDRPVLIRSLGPESSAERRKQYVASVSGAARMTHPHLARVFAVGEVEGGAYAVSEWTGGATMADRVAAGQPVDLPDFLPNAAGLAGALAALHAGGAVHGRIDPSAIAYSGAHAARLGAFGRSPGWEDTPGDVRALCESLETALTGSPPGGPPPSERVDGVPRAVDTILRAGQAGGLTAEDLEKALRAAPTPRAPASDSGPTSRRLLISAITLVILAIGLVAVGFVLSGRTALVVPTPTTTAHDVTTTTVGLTTTVVSGAVATVDVDTLDPFGEGGENDQLAPLVIDGDIATEWQTEGYFDPLPLLKPGVGLVVGVLGTPHSLEVASLTEGTVFEIRWAGQPDPDPDAWETVAEVRSSPGATVVDLPPRLDGYWLIWLTSLPLGDDGSYRASLAELRFLP